MKKYNSPLRMLEDKAHTHASKKNSVGIVGETHIWDGPLNQAGRPHGKGSSSGARGMKLKLGAVPYEAGP
jgi:phage terminase large subunit-like protein